MTIGGAQPFVDTTTGEPPVRGFLHSAGPKAKGFLVLTHGAGGDCKAALLVALAEQFAAAGLSTLRCDLPYRQRRPTGPPSPSDAKHDQEGLRRAVELMRGRFSGAAYLGGSSYGGRQASMLAASNAALVEGLLLLSYPLHPPGRPTQMRTQHFPSLRTPSLFVIGTRDSFATIEELHEAIKLIPARTDLLVIEGAPHGLSLKRKSSEVPEQVVQRFLHFFR